MRDLRPFHVTRWLDAQGRWGTSSRRGAITALKRAMNWAAAERLIVASPLGALLRPKPPRREVLIADAQHSAMMLAVDGRGQGKRAAAMRPVLIALRHSGTRPGMVAGVTCENVGPDTSVWILPEDKTRRRTGRPLVIYLSPCLQTLTRIAMAARGGHGPLAELGDMDPARTETAMALFDWTQNAAEIWRGSNNRIRREILDAVCLNRTLSDATLNAPKRKPFDVFAERPDLKNSRGDWIRTSDLLTPSQTR